MEPLGNNDKRMAFDVLIVWTRICWKIIGTIPEKSFKARHDEGKNINEKI
jgi:hypothetical protein